MSRPKKRKTTGNQPAIKLPMALITITCPDKGCMKCFKTERGLASYFDKSPGCAQAITKVLQCLSTQELSNPLAFVRQTQTADGSIETDTVSDAIESVMPHHQTQTTLLRLMIWTSWKPS